MSIYTLPDLPYDYAGLEPHLSGRIVELHHDKHHQAYVKGANTAVERIAEATDAGDLADVTLLERNLAFHVSGHVMHSIYWANLSPDGGDRPDGELASAIDDSFGSFDRMKALMSAATTSVQGSGWGVLAWEPMSQRLAVMQAMDHQDNMSQGSVPLLVFDIWEHAFYLQYENDKSAYVEGLWNLVNWPDVSRRLDSVDRSALVAA